MLTWMYLGSGASLWIAALWHTTFDMVTATPPVGASRAPVLSAAVIAAAVVVRHAHVDGTAPAGGS